MRGRAFRGSPLAIASWQPFITPRPMQKRGVPIGIDLQSGRVVLFHPFGMPTHSSSFVIEGEKESGKSTFMKSLILRSAALQAWDVDGQPTEWRSRVNSRKPEQGVAEYAPVTETLRSTVYDIGRGAAINPLALFTREADVIDVSINLVQEVAGGPVGEKVSMAVMAALRGIFMSNLRDKVSPAILEMRLRNLTKADFVSYIQDNHNRFFKELNASPEDEVRLKKQLQIDTSTPAVDESYVEAARFAADCFTQLLYGDYGGIFAGTESLYEVLSNPMLTLEWENVNDKSRAILEAILMKAEASAMSYTQAELATGRNPARIIPHASFGDEEAGAVKLLMHLRYEAERANKARMYPTASFRAVQYYVQLTDVGSAGSEMRTLAREIELGVGARILFRQPSDPDFLERFSKLGMSDFNVSLLHQQTQGQMMIYVRDQPVLRVQHVLFPSEVPLVKTNSVRDRMRGAPVMSKEQLVQMARSNGVVEVGSPTEG
jgi:hypothetical protein